MPICRSGEEREVHYTEERFRLLEDLRREALVIIDALGSGGVRGYLHGSVARGDVNKDSDIDIVIPQYVSPFLVEDLILKTGLKIYKISIIQATPHSTPKVYYYFDELETKVVSFPLAKLTDKEAFFYKFGGMISGEEIRSGKRVKGVDKRLMLIHPTDYGHYEECIVGRSGYVARILNIPESIVNERIYMLGKREIYGRTGVFLEYVLHPGETVLDAIRTLSSINRYFREAIE